MNLHQAFDRRNELNEKMARLLLQGLIEERDRYLKAIANYPPDRMVKYGQPMLDIHNGKIETVSMLIKEKFS